MSGGSAATVEPIPPEAHVPALAQALGDKKTVLDGLTARQRRFVEEYPKDLNATQAAIRAGYSPRSAADMGFENLRKPNIIDALTALVATRSERTGIDRSWVLSNLVDTHEKAKGKDTVGHMAHRLKALELIGRHVDVRAFRLGLGYAGDDGGAEQELWDLSLLTDEEFDLFERLLAKVTIVKPHAGGAGGTPAEAGPSADSAGPGGDSGDV